MSGNSGVFWVCLIGGMLVQLTYMILPFQRWDWARYLGSAAVPVFVWAKMNHAIPGAPAELFLCGMFTCGFALLFQERLLPRLGEGAILMWTAIFLCVIVELEPWHSVAAYVPVGVGLAVIGLLLVRMSVPYVLKLAVYGWFLLVVVAMGVLQFRGSDFSLVIAGRTDQIDYRFALIDGMAGAYIGVHAVFLFELLPIPAKGEQWAEFKARWGSYLDEVVSRFDAQQLPKPAALALVLGIPLVAYVNHRLEWIPDRALTNLVLLGLPMAWQAACRWQLQRQPVGP